MIHYTRLLLISCFSLFISACDSSTEQKIPPDSQVDPSHLRRGLQADPGTLDPHKSIMTDEWAVLRDVYMGLTYPGADGRPGPGLADSWAVSEDGYTYTFSLRPDAAWSNGAAVMAQHVVNGFLRLFDPKTASPSAPLLYVIENARDVSSGRRPLADLGVTALDEQTIRISLERPTPNLPEMLAMPFAVPQPDGDTATLFNGPFMIEEWVAGSVIRLVRNPYYRAAVKPQLEQISYVPLSDDEAAMRQFQSGQLDLHPWYPSNRREWLDENYPSQAASGPALGVSYLVFNTQQAPFNSAEVRRALALAVDSSLLADRVLSGAVDTAARFVPGAVTGYRGPETDTRAQEERIAEARQLMVQAGYTADTPLRFDFRVRQTPDDRKVAIALQAFWKSIYAEASLITTDLKTHFDDLESGRFAVADAGWALFNAPESFLFLLSESDAAQLNYGRYQNPAFVAAFTAALEATDLEARAALFAEAEALMLSDAAVAPLFHYQARAVVRRDVTGFVLNPGAINPSVYLGKIAN